MCIVKWFIDHRILEVLIFFDHQTATSKCPNRFRRKPADNLGDVGQKTAGYYTTLKHGAKSKTHVSFRQKHACVDLRKNSRVRDVMTWKQSSHPVVIEWCFTGVRKMENLFLKKRISVRTAASACRPVIYAPRP